ncbi:MAG: hypothetical protein RR471_05075 [Bacteroides sp.]|uniref:hypothetical protein n=1 Tax=Bacteroides sp. TaxID=29523 RepID=UPI002FC6408F
MNKVKQSCAVICLCVLPFLVSCIKKNTVQEPRDLSDSTMTSDTIFYVKGDVAAPEINKHTIAIVADERCKIHLASDHPGLIYVVQYEDGMNLTGQTYSTWEGEMKQGIYTITVGWMRSSDSPPNTKTSYSLLVQKPL